MHRKSKPAGKFKSKGEAILKSQRPSPASMVDFLTYTQNHKGAGPQMHKSTNLQKHNCANENFLRAINYQMRKPSKEQKHKVCRLHIQIRQDLVDKLLDTVFKRKRDPDVRMRDASQRAIIEAALEEYFMSKGI